ncbi:MAG TPA: hypothetical protein VLR90_02785 [Blastocatellia bacterium]|nr:hypothetical protein [Blastocatellia bacterium]
MDQTRYTTTKISESFEMPGYVLDDDVLQRIDSICKQAVLSTKESEENHLKTTFIITPVEQNQTKFRSITNLRDYLNSESSDIKSINLEYNLLGTAAINLIFTSKGKIELSAYSNALDFQFNIDRLKREIRRCDQEYNWLIRKYIFSSASSLL